MVLTFKTWRLVSFFHKGLSSKSRHVVEMIHNGEFNDNGPEVALDYLH